MIGAVAHAERLPLAIWVDERHGEHILLRVHAPVVAQGEGPVDGRVRYGAPEVDDLEPPLEKIGCVGGGEVAVDAGDGGFVGLVNVGLGDWLAPLGVVIDFTGATTADGWMEGMIMSPLLQSPERARNPYCDRTGRPCSRRSSL